MFKLFDKCFGKKQSKKHVKFYNKKPHEINEKIIDAIEDKRWIRQGRH
jgi:hypothetical protein